nr:MAG TPA: hypothetical protein [Caudoviricetes sp.]
MRNISTQASAQRSTARYSSSTRRLCAMCLSSSCYVIGMACTVSTTIHVR